jgi:hypothetical protein
LRASRYGVEHTPMAKAIEQYYGFKSNTVYEAMQNPRHVTTGLRDRPQS